MAAFNLYAVCQGDAMAITALKIKYFGGCFIRGIILVYICIRSYPVYYYYVTLHQIAKQFLMKH